MRYRKGSLILDNFRDQAVLHFVADSRYVTHAQLFRFAQLEYYEGNRPSFSGAVSHAPILGDPSGSGIRLT
jgi:hypothetical protein